MTGCTASITPDGLRDMIATHPNSPPDAAVRPGGSGMPKQAKVTVSAVPEPALPLPEYPLAGVKAPASLGRKGVARNTGKQLSEAAFRRLWGDLTISVEEIGRRLGISGNAVKMRAKSRKLPPRPKCRPFARRYNHSRMACLYGMGLSMAAVAELCGCAEHTVFKALQRAGVRSRDREDPATTNNLAVAVLAASARETRAAMKLAEMVDGRDNGARNRSARWAA
jgi:DNA-binding CsgD family transcriptional regulator